MNWWGLSNSQLMKVMGVVGVAAIVIPVSVVASPSPVRVAELTQWSYDPATNQLTVVMSEPTTPRYFLVAQPARIVVDIPNARIGTTSEQKVYANATIRQIRLSQFQPDVARLVLELAPNTILMPKQVSLEPLKTPEMTGNGRAKTWVLRPLVAKPSQSTPVAVPPSPRSIAVPPPAIASQPAQPASAPIAASTTQPTTPAVQTMVPSPAPAATPQPTSKPTLAPIVRTSPTPTAGTVSSQSTTSSAPASLPTPAPSPLPSPSMTAGNAPTTPATSRPSSLLAQPLPTDSPSQTTVSTSVTIEPTSSVSPAGGDQGVTIVVPAPDTTTPHQTTHHTATNVSQPPVVSSVVFTSVQPSPGNPASTTASPSAIAANNPTTTAPTTITNQSSAQSSMTAEPPTLPAQPSSVATLSSSRSSSSQPSPVTTNASPGTVGSNPSASTPTADRTTRSTQSPTPQLAPVVKPAQPAPVNTTSQRPNPNPSPSATPSPRPASAPSTPINPTPRQETLPPAIAPTNTALTVTVPSPNDRPQVRANSPIPPNTVVTFGASPSASNSSGNGQAPLGRPVTSQPQPTANTSAELPPATPIGTTPVIITAPPLPTTRSATTNDRPAAATIPFGTPIPGTSSATPPRMTAPPQPIPPPPVNLPPSNTAPQVVAFGDRPPGLTTSITSPPQAFPQGGASVIYSAVIPNPAANNPAGVLLPVGTLLSLRYPGSGALRLQAAEGRQEVLLLQTEVRDATGRVILSAGTPVFGRFEASNQGSRFIAQSLALANRNITFAARSEPLFNPLLQPNQILQVVLMENLGQL